MSCLKDIIHNVIFEDYKNYSNPGEYCSIINMLTFIDYIKNKLFTDYDGFGLLVYRNRVIEDSKLFLMDGNENAFVSYKGFNLRLNQLLVIFGSDVKICWFNK